MVIATLLMGERPEPYLPAVLASLDGAIDCLVVHDNSNHRQSANRQALDACALAQRGQVRIIEAPFSGFSDARNRCLDYIREHLAESRPWVGRVDCDEVHGPHLRMLTRQVLPSLPSNIGAVDGYFVQFMQTLDYYTSLDRYHNLFVRWNDQLRWEAQVHEKLRGIRGHRLCLPYVFYHYGYVQPNRDIQEKWLQYQALGDGTLSHYELAGADLSRMFVHEVPNCMPYRRRHPPALQTVRQPVGDEAARTFRGLADSHTRMPLVRLQLALRACNYRMRLLWRAAQAPFRGVSLLVWPSILRMAL